jgi:CheY-like chemotaxis protein
MVGEFLKKVGYEVMCAADGREALDLATGYPDRIDLLISDVMMPRMGGFELALRLREQRHDIEILMMSGYTGGALSGRSKELRDLPFLAKPFSMRQLQTSIEDLLGRPIDGGSLAVKSPVQIPHSRLEQSST